MNFCYFEKVFEVVFNYVMLKKLNLSVIIIDIDYFKWVNDIYGYLVGNGVLFIFS